MSQKIKVTVEAARALLNQSTITKAEAESIMDSLQQATSDASPWWLTVLKVLAYAIGLILAGYGTTAAAATILPFYGL